MSLLQPYRAAATTETDAPAAEPPRSPRSTWPLVSHRHRRGGDSKAMDGCDQHIGDEAQHQLLQRQIGHVATARILRPYNCAYFFMVILRCASWSVVSSSVPAM